MRHPIRLAATALTLLSLAAVNDLLAQRRTEGSSGGTSRGSGGGSSGGSGGSQPSRGSSGGSGGSSSGGSQARGSSGGSSTTPRAAADASRGRGTTTPGNGASTGKPASRGSDDGAAASGTGSRERDTPSTPNAGTGAGSGSGSGSANADRPRSGKIGAVRRAATDARRDGRTVVIGGPVYVGCYSCDYWGWYGGRWGQYHGGWWYPSHRPEPVYDEEENEAVGGQGYLPYPYASAEESDDTFVRRAWHRRGYAAISAHGFADKGSDTRAGTVALEGAMGRIHGELEYANYAEPVQGATDRIQTMRAAVGIQPRLGSRAYLVAAIGGRGLWLNRGGGSAGGPEGTLGVQLFPMKPIGVNVTGRLAAMSWSRSRDHFALRELNTTGSVFVGRAELQGGWHWMKIGSAPAFGGPMAGVRLWF